MRSVERAAFIESQCLLVGRPGEAKNTLARWRAVQRLQPLPIQAYRLDRVLVAYLVLKKKPRAISRKLSFVERTASRLENSRCSASAGVVALQLRSGGEDKILVVTGRQSPADHRSRRTRRWTTGQGWRHRLRGDRLLPTCLRAASMKEDWRGFHRASRGSSYNHNRHNRFYRDGGSRTCCRACSTRG